MRGGKTQLSARPVGKLDQTASNYDDINVFARQPAERA